MLRSFPRMVCLVQLRDVQIWYVGNNAITQSRPTHVTEWKRQQEENYSKTTTPLFISRGVMAKQERALSTTYIKPPQTMGASINNGSTTEPPP